MVLRKSTTSFAFAGIDMAFGIFVEKLAAAALPVAGKGTRQVNYFYYLARGSVEQLRRQCQDGLAKGSRSSSQGRY
jgi:hypothetical protein